MRVENKGAMERIFLNRAEAGRRLAEKLTAYRGRADALVLGLPRGGVPVAYEVAKCLRAHLDVFIVRKLGVPGFEELAAGAIASGGVRVLNEDVLRALPNAEQVIASVTARETAELERRGGLDHTFIAQHVLGAEAFLAEARRLPLAEAAALCEIEAAQTGVTEGNAETQSEM